MKKILFLALLCLIAGQVFSQVKSVVKLRGDTIEILKNQGNGELAIRNSTRDTAGFALNVGQGAVQFHAPHRINDSTIQIGPITIIIQGPGSPPGTNSGDTIYIAAAVDTFYTVPIGTAAGMIQTQYTISGPNFSQIRHSNWGPGLLTTPHLAADSLAYMDVDTAALRAYIDAAYGSIVITADNGLNKNTPTNVQLGGPLLLNTLVDAGAFTLSISGSHASNQALNVYNTSSGIALEADGTSGTGAVIRSTTGTAMEVTTLPVSSNVSSQVATFFRGTSSTAANGMGGYLNFQLEDGSNNIQDAVRQEWNWIIAATGTRTAEWRLKGVTLAGAVVDWVDVAGGTVTAHPTGYGFQSTSGTGGGLFVGTAVGAYAAASDANGTSLFVNSTNSANNTVVRLVEMARQGTYNSAVGVGTSTEYDLHNSSGSVILTGHISHVMTDITLGSEATEFRFGVRIGTLSVGVSDVFLIRGKKATISAPLMPTYASNAAAAVDLDVGDFYYNGDDVKRVH